MAGVGFTALDEKIIELSSTDVSACFERVRESCNGLERGCGERAISAFWDCLPYKTQWNTEFRKFEKERKTERAKDIISFYVKLDDDQLNTLSRSHDVHTALRYIPGCAYEFITLLLGTDVWKWEDTPAQVAKRDSEEWREIKRKRDLTSTDNRPSSKKGRE